MFSFAKFSSKCFRPQEFNASMTTDVGQESTSPTEGNWWLSLTLLPAPMFKNCRGGTLRRAVSFQMWHTWLGGVMRRTKYWSGCKRATTHPRRNVCCSIRLSAAHHHTLRLREETIINVFELVYSYNASGLCCGLYAYYIIHCRFITSRQFYTTLTREIGGVHVLGIPEYDCDGGNW